MFIHFNFDWRAKLVNVKQASLKYEQLPQNLATQFHNSIHTFKEH